MVLRTILILPLGFSFYRGIYMVTHMIGILLWAYSVFYLHGLLMGQVARPNP